MMSLEEDKTNEHGVVQPFDLKSKQQRTNSTTNAATTHVGRNNDVHQLVAKPTRWEDPH